MLKELIISIIIMIAIIIGNTITQNYTVETIELLNSDLMEIKAEMEKGQENENEELETEKIKEKREKVQEDWKERHDKLAYYIEHNELEKIENNIIGLESYLKTNDYSEAMGELDRCMFFLEHIRNKNEFNLQNIF